MRHSRRALGHGHSSAGDHPSSDTAQNVSHGVLRCLDTELWDLAVTNTDVQPRGRERKRGWFGEAGQARMEDQLCDPSPGCLTWSSVPGSVSRCGQAGLQLLWLLRA